MVLVDTSIWVDHLRATDERLADLLRREQVLIHVYVLGEISLGGLGPPAERLAILDALSDLPSAPLATPYEVQQLIESHKLFGTGIGYVDAHLLAATRLVPGAKLWTRDKRLNGVSLGMQMAYEAMH